VDIQSKDPVSVLAFAQSAISFRQSNPALRLGGFSMLYEDEACLIFSRSLGEASCLAGFNFSGETRTIPGLFKSRKQPDLAVGGVQIAEDEVTLGPVSAFLISLNPL
jgi:glycosidase